MPDASSLDLLRGTLDLLVLRALSGGASHGFGVARWIEQAARDTLQIEEGSLYPSLHRMERKGWIEAEWGVSEHNRRAKYYRLTAAGRKHLRAETDNWSRFAQAVAWVLEAPTAAQRR